MNNNIIKYKAFLLALLCTIVSCSKEKDPPPWNTPPVFSPVVTQPCKITEYQLDMAISDGFDVFDNYNNPWDDPGFYDVVRIEGKGIIPAIGEFNFFLDEYADTAALSDSIIWNYFSISQAKTDPLYLGGTSSINLKKLIRQGGGPFEGLFTITSGSAQQCDQNVFTNPDTLTVTGNLNVALGTVTLTVKGKVYF